MKKKLTLFLIPIIFMFYGINLAIGQDSSEFVASYGTKGSGDGQFILPHGIDFDSKENVYITDRIKNDIQEFTPNGTFIMK